MFAAPNRFRRPLIGLALGVPVTVLALIAAIVSAGAGHGDYVAARLMFPAPMLASLLSGDTIGAPSIVIALLQFPAYGALIGWTLGRQSSLPIVIAAAVHIAAAILCFSGMIPNFS